MVASRKGAKTQRTDEARQIRRRFETQRHGGHGVYEGGFGRTMGAELWGNLLATDETVALEFPPLGGLAMQRDRLKAELQLKKGGGHGDGYL